jgi:DNA-binding NtrC family response regulator
MNPATVLRERGDSGFAKKSVTSIDRAPGRPTVLIATVDPEIREALVELLETTSVNAIWVSSVKDVKSLVAGNLVVACLCGFWLQDGTYREVIRHLRRERISTPAIIVSPPACPQEFRDYLAAMNLGPLDFLAYPYRQSDFESMLEAAIGSHPRLKRQQVPEQVAEKNSDFRVRGAA